MTVLDLSPGDLIEFYWYDILIDETGDPVKARLLKRQQFGLFLGIRTDASGIEFMVTASGTDIDEDAQPQSGWQATPTHLVKKLKRIRKAKKNGSTRKASPVREVSGGVDQVRGGAGIRVDPGGGGRSEPS